MNAELLKFRFVRFATACGKPAMDNAKHYIMAHLFENCVSETAGKGVVSRSNYIHRSKAILGTNQLVSHILKQIHAQRFFHSGYLRQGTSVVF